MSSQNVRRQMVVYFEELLVLLRLKSWFCWALPSWGCQDSYPGTVPVRTVQSNFNSPVVPTSAATSGRRAGTRATATGARSGVPNGPALQHSVDCFYASKAVADRPTGVGGGNRVKSPPQMPPVQRASDPAWFCSRAVLMGGSPARPRRADLHLPGLVSRDGPPRKD